MNIEDKIKSISLENEEECCGLIVKNGNNTFIYSCNNDSAQKLKYFIINPKDYLKASVLGKITGLYHSHKNKTTFSLADKILSEGHKLDLIMYCRGNDKFYYYKPCGYKNPYIGKNFIYKTNDCFTLLRDYYKEELQIDIGNYDYDCNWGTNNPDIFKNNWKNGGFTKICDGPIDNISILEPNDCILQKYWKNNEYPGHILIYLGGELVLNQPFNGISRIEPLTEPMKNRIAYVLRHKNLINYGRN